MQRNLTQSLEDVFNANKNKIAIVTGDGQEISFERLQHFVHALAENLKLSGVKPNDCIAPMINDFTANLMMRIACMYVGATTLLTMRSSGAVESGVPLKWVIVAGNGQSGKRGVLHFNRTWLRRPNSKFVPESGFRLINASSGTTGKPKYMMSNERTITSRVSRSGSNRPIVDGTSLAAYGSGTGVGFTHPLRVLLSGNTLVCTDLIGAKTLERMEKYKVEHILAPPQYLPTLMDALKKENRTLDSLKSIWSGGGSISKAFAVRCESLFGCKLYSTYGSSEAGAIAFGRPAESDVEVGFVGQFSPTIDLKFVNESGVVSDPQIGGEILIRVPKENRVIKMFGAPMPYDEEGFYSPGDVGYLTSKGDLVINGRTKDIINHGGNKVAPSVIEAVALKFGNIEQVVAFGILNDVGSEDIGLAIVSEGKFDLDAFRKYVSANFKKRFAIQSFVVDEIPQTESQKVDKNALRELMRQQL